MRISSSYKKYIIFKSNHHGCGSSWSTIGTPFLTHDFLNTLRLSPASAWPPGTALVSDSVPFQVIEDWLLGESNDALNAPFSLFIYRYSTPGEEEDPELFEDEGDSLHFSF